MTQVDPRAGADSRPGRLLHDLPLRAMLVAGFLVSGLIPLMVLSLASYRMAYVELTRQSQRQLEAVRDIKRRQVAGFFEERFADLRVLAASSGLQRAFREAAEASGRHEAYLRELLGQYGNFEGFALLDGADGRLLLACERSGTGRPALGDLPPGLWREALAERRVVLSDILPSGGAGGPGACQFAAAPLGGDAAGRGVLAARLSLEPVDRMMRERSGMGRSGETYLVGADRRMRSDSHLDPAGHSLRASLAGSVAGNGADTEAVRRSLAGETGTALIRDYRGVEVLSAFAPLTVGRLTWVIAAEIDLAEIEGQIRRALNPDVLAITAGAAMLVVLLALVITHFIGRNIGRVAEQVRGLIDGVLHDRTDGQIDQQQVGVDFRAVSVQVNQLAAAFRGHVERIRRLEEHQRFTQKVEAIGALAGGIAHDFNNVLTGLLAYTRLALADLPADSPSRGHLQEVVAGIHRAGDLVHRILPAAQDAPPGPPRADAREVCLETIAVLKATLPGTIRVQDDLGGEAVPVACAPGPLRQLLMNLCINAYHAMQEGGGVLSISLSRPGEGGGDADVAGWARLIVRDDGCGMTAEVLARLFEPFFTTKPAGIGSGLGLASVKETLRSCGGRIRVSSEPEKGSEFAVDFPPAGPATEPETTRDAPLFPRRPGRILFVEDDEQVRIAEGRVLEELGFPVDLAGDGAEALRLFEGAPGRWRLVITDLVLPGISGLELAGRLHQRDARLPIFLATGRPELLRGVDPRAVGIRAVLAKPFDMAELYSALREIAAV